MKQRDEENLAAALAGAALTGVVSGGLGFFAIVKKQSRIAELEATVTELQCKVLNVENAAFWAHLRASAAVEEQGQALAARDEALSALASAKSLAEKMRQESIAATAMAARDRQANQQREGQLAAERDQARIEHETLRAERDRLAAELELLRLPPAASS